MTKRNKYWEKRIKNDLYKAQCLMADGEREEYKQMRGVASRLNAEINALYAEIQNKGIENINRSTLYQLSHYNTLRNQIQKEYGKIGMKNVEITEEILTSIVENQFREMGLQTPEQKLIGYGKQDVKQIVYSNWSGNDFKTISMNNAAMSGQILQQKIEDVILAGKPPRQAAKELQKSLNITYNDAKRIIRTESIHAFNEANYQSFEKSGIEKVEIVDSGNDNECEDCEEIAGIYTLAEAPIPPFHPNCACVLVPYIEE